MKPAQRKKQMSTEPTFTEHERKSFLYRTVEEMRLINDAVDRRYQKEGRPDGRQEVDA